MDVELPTDPKKWEDDKVLSKAIEKLSDDDRKLLGRYMMISAMGSAFGKNENALAKKVTVGEALDKMRKFDLAQAEDKAKADALAAEVAAKEEAAAAAMRGVVTVAFTSKGFKAQDVMNGQMSDAVTLGLTVRNDSEKDIIAWEGRAKFTDLLDNVLRDGRINSTDTLPAGQTASNTWSIDLNQFINADTVFKNTPKEKMTFEFTPSKIVFADGTKLPTE